MANLAPSQLLKYEWRRMAFLDRYTAGRHFELLSGKKIRVIPDPLTALYLASGTAADLRTIRILGVDGNEYRLSDFKKSKEFKGESVPRGYTAEDRQCSLLNERLLSFQEVIPVRTPEGLIEVYRFTSLPATSRNPKADILGLNASGKPVLFITFKDSTKANRMNQWGGISRRFEPEQYYHSETQDFIQSLRSRFQGIIPPETIVRRAIQDRELRMRALYGKEFGGPFSKQNVHFVLGGKIRLLPDPRHETLMLVAPFKLENGQEPSVPMQPTFYMRRGERNDLGIKRARVAIFPREYRPAEWI